MTIYYDILWPDHQYHTARIAAVWNTTILEEEESESVFVSQLFLPRSFIQYQVVPFIIGTIFVVSIVYYTLLQQFDVIVTNYLIRPSLPQQQQEQQGPSQSSSSTRRTTTTRTSPTVPNHHQRQSPPSYYFTTFERRKLCYQMTNMIVNLCFSCTGIYYEYFYHHSSHYQYHITTTTPGTTSLEQSTLVVATQQQQQQQPTLEETIMGYNSFVYLSAGQIGYQLWSIPMGIWVVPEPLSMLIHHLTVIVCASMSGFLQFGFRYYTPFFYGIVELSSISLAVMNAFRDHPHTLQVIYPKINYYNRYLFAALFLTIRIILFVPRKVRFLRDQVLLWTSVPKQPQQHQQYRWQWTIGTSTTSVVFWYQCFMGIVSISALFLLLLQIYWATLIVKGVLKSLCAPQQQPTDCSDNATTGCSSTISCNKNITPTSSHCNNDIKFHNDHRSCSSSTRHIAIINDGSTDSSRRRRQHNGTSNGTTTINNIKNGKRNNNGPYTNGIGASTTTLNTMDKKID